jgi:hypothetical protein
MRIVTLNDRDTTLPFQPASLACTVNERDHITRLRSVERRLKIAARWNDNRRRMHRRGGKDRHDTRAPCEDPQTHWSCS